MEERTLPDGAILIKVKRQHGKYPCGDNLEGEDSIMECIGQSVTHQKFGVGKIKERKDNTITVFFQDYGAHTFLYPQAFEQYLKAKDADFAKAVKSDLDKSWEEQADRELENRLKIEKMTHQAKLERQTIKNKTKAPAAKASPKSKPTALPNG